MFHEGFGVARNGRGIRIRGGLGLLERGASVGVFPKTTRPNGIGIPDVFFSIKIGLHLRIQKSNG